MIHGMNVTRYPTERILRKKCSQVILTASFISKPPQPSSSGRSAWIVPTVPNARSTTHAKHWTNICRARLRDNRPSCDTLVSQTSEQAHQGVRGLASTSHRTARSADLDRRNSSERFTRASHTSRRCCGDSFRSSLENPSASSPSSKRRRNSLTGLESADFIRLCPE